SLKRGVASPEGQWTIGRQRDEPAQGLYGLAWACGSGTSLGAGARGTPPGARPGVAKGGEGNPGDGDGVRIGPRSISIGPSQQDGIASDSMMGAESIVRVRPVNRLRKPQLLVQPLQAMRELEQPTISPRPAIAARVARRLRIMARPLSFAVSS